MLLVTGAAHGDRRSELLDLNAVLHGGGGGRWKKTPVIPACRGGEYPDPVEGAIGGIVMGRPAICGGATVRDRVY